ncbi:MAG: ribonuclease J, partial [Caldilineaceae bacterium]
MAEDSVGKVAPLLRVIPLGGVGEIGKNMLVIEAGRDLLVIDAGLMFPTIEMHGIDIVIPDAEYVLERPQDIKGVILTHGHEDHIGAVSYLVEEGMNAPIFATALTRGLLEVKLREQKQLGEVQLNTVTEDDVLTLGAFTVEFFHTCHSFPDSVGVSILTDAGRVVHTSDYRFDATPVDGKLTDEVKLRRWGDEGVLLLLADSTNAERADVSPSERSLDVMLDRVIGEAPGRVLLATFASNLGRVQQVIHAAQRAGRRVGVI